MTDGEIDAFLAVVRTGSISRAAEKLFLSQSALSRRIQSLEEELGYQLFQRKKGVRAVELTPSGRAFVESSKKWKLLWGEMQEAAALNRQVVLNISTINSVSTYVMPGLFHRFLVENPQIHLTIRTVRSVDAVRYVESGVVDLAFFSDDIYLPNVEMKPAYREKLLFVCRRDLGYPDIVHPQALDISRHIYMPWNREYEDWYRQWFSARQKPRVWSDSMQLMEEFLLLKDYWAILPASAALCLCQNPALSVHAVEEGPPDRVIYYLLGLRRMPQATRLFLRAFDEHLRTVHSRSVQSLIQPSALEG